MQEEHGFDGRAGVTAENVGEVAGAEFCGADRGRQRGPPGGFIFSMMKTHSPKEPRIAEDERLFRLRQDQVIVLLGTESARLRAQGSAHPEMQTEPVVTGKFEEHLLAARGRAEEAGAGEAAADSCGIAVAEDALLWVQLDCADLCAEPGVPLFAIIFDLGQLGHGGSLEVDFRAAIGERLPAVEFACYSSPAWKK